MSTQEILYIVSTRPEVIKTVPAILASRSLGSSVTLMLASQHKEMTHQVLEAFGVRADSGLNHAPWSKLSRVQ